MPPLAIVVGPTEVPVGENGCLASATRNLPSGPVYRCAAEDEAARSAKATAETGDRMIENRVGASANLRLMRLLARWLLHAEFGALDALV
jgi:hypothetical protein